jgi:mono/diheme cytochrome c family protein
VVSGLRRVANGVELAVLAAVVVTVVLLFTNDPTQPPAAPATAVEAAAGIDAAALYGSNCAGCHGGDGSGGIGPRLSGNRVVARFPEAADQIAVVSGGRGGMPAFSGWLSDDEIAAVVEYTRTALAGG